MVQVIGEGRMKPRSASQKLGLGLSGAMNQYLEHAQEQKRVTSENKAFKELGMNIEGITDPKARQEIAKQLVKIQGQNQLLEQLGLTGGMGQNSRTSGLGLETTNQRPNENMQGKEQSGNDENEIKVNIPKLPHSQEVITAASIRNPSLGNMMQRQNEEATAEARHREKQQLNQDLSHKKEVSESYKENKDYINNTYDKYEDSLRRESILDRMDQLENSGELSESGVINLLEQLGLNQEWLKNPANEEYTKLALDLLGGGSLQADYGSRVLASEFKVSLQRIPTLMQTPEGRKQIKENIKTMLLPSQLKQDRMKFYLDKSENTGNPLPHNLRGKILQDIKPQLERAYDEFKQRNGRYKVKEGTSPEENVVEKYFYMTNGDIDKAAKMMKEDGYNVTANKPSGISGGSSRFRVSR